MIDLRSDTASKPTPAMREAIANAQVGDEQLREDPTVNELERRAADLLGQEDSVFVPTATMANEIALRVLGEPGDELIAEENAHILIAELGGPAVHAGLMTRPLPAEAGRFTTDQVRAAARRGDLGHVPTTRIVAIENTHNSSGGRVWPLAEIEAMADTCRELELSLHIDGARLFNAAVASGEAPAGDRRTRRHRDDLLLQGPRLPAGRDRGRLSRADAAGAALQAPVRRRDAAGGDRRRGLRLRARPPRRAPGRGPRTRPRLAEGLHEAGVPVDLEQVETNFVQVDVGSLGLDVGEAIERLLGEGVRVSGRCCQACSGAVTHLGSRTKTSSGRSRRSLAGSAFRRSPARKNASAAST